jgi:hypothetical protein
MSDLELLADTMEEWSTTSGDHHMMAAAAIRQLIKLEAALQSGEPVAVADRGVLNWIDGKQFNREADLYTHPQPVVPPQWKVVMRGMVEYAECNDPGNPYLDQAKTLLSAGKEDV